MAGGGAARTAAYDGREVAMFAISSKNRDMRALVLVVYVQEGEISTSARALRTLERVRPALQVAARRGRWHAKVAKSRFLRF